MTLDVVVCYFSEHTIIWNLLPRHWRKSFIETLYSALTKVCSADDRLSSYKTRWILVTCLVVVL